MFTYFNGRNFASFFEKVVSCEDSFSRTVSGKIFREDLFLRIYEGKIFCDDLFSRIYEGKIFQDD